MYIYNIYIYNIYIYNIYVHIYIYIIYIYFLDNTSNKPSNFKTKNWVEINDNARGRYSTISREKFKITMLKSRLYG